MFCSYWTSAANSSRSGSSRCRSLKASFVAVDGTSGRKGGHHAPERLACICSALHGCISTSRLSQSVHGASLPNAPQDRSRLFKEVWKEAQGLGESLAPAQLHRPAGRAMERPIAEAGLPLAAPLVKEAGAPVLAAMGSLPKFGPSGLLLRLTHTRSISHTRAHSSPSIKVADSRPSSLFLPFFPTQLTHSRCSHSEICT